MRFVVLALVSLLACRTLAQEPRPPEPAVSPEAGALHAPDASPETGALHEPGALPEPPRSPEPPAWREPAARGRTTPPVVGSCLGGSCAVGQPANVPMPPDAGGIPRAERRSVKRPGRFAYAGAVIGAVSAGLLLGGSVAIAVADHPPSERITRGIWFSELAVATPLVALSAFTARRGSSFVGYRGLRSLGWVAYGAAVSDGILLWYAAFQDTPMPAALTIAAGAIATFALLPHALDALICARKARSRSAVAWGVTARGVGVRF